MKIFRLLTLAWLVAPLAPGEDVAMTAKRLEREGAVIRGYGDVQVRIGSMLLQATEGILNPETGEVQLKGRPSTTLPGRSDHTIIRYGSRAVVTVRPIEVSADTLRVKDGLLRARGHVEAKSGTTLIEGDELDVLLNIGDAEARGNVRLNGVLPASIDSRRGLRPQFPPDVIR